MSQEMKVRKIAEGKTKIIREIIGTDKVLVESKDDITAGDGLKHDVLENKGILATATTCNCFRLLNLMRIPNHFIDQVDERMFRAWRLKMMPIEMVVRRIATGSYLDRDPGTEEGSVFDALQIEFFLKDDAAHDPLMIWSEKKSCFELHAAHNPLGMGYIKDLPRDTKLLVPTDPLKVGLLSNLVTNVFAALEKAWASQDVVLVDLKIECGFAVDNEALMVGDVIDNDSWRIWPGGDKARMKDKQVYRNLRTKTPEALKNVERNYQWVAEATAKFVS